MTGALSLTPATRRICSRSSSWCRRRSPRRRPSTWPRRCWERWECRPYGSGGKSRASSSTACRERSCGGVLSCPDGVATPEDIDRVMRDGLGRRWSILGPFEVAELNARGGIDAHAKLLGPATADGGGARAVRPLDRRTGGHRLQSGAGALSPGRLGQKRRMAGPCPDGTGGLPPGQPGRGSPSVYRRRQR